MKAMRSLKTVFIACALLLCYRLQAQQLVLRGDYPDPSVVKIGDTYWATATTSNWAPVYPLLQSKDLVNWKTSSFVFPQLPVWADYYFWAPEISYDNGKVYLYYSAHKKNGNLCVGVASADKPEGPYTDHGPVICQDVGSIDAFPMRDENGRLYLVWKEDANSVGKPTPIWIQEMDEKRTGMLGKKKELFRNTETWEANLVEGVSMMKHADYYYAFYAAAGCCGAACSYGTGVARAKSLFGPWEKYKGNPVLTSDEKWNCPGHGTPVENDGRYYFMYHAYDKTSTVYTGREGLLVEFQFNADGWIEFVKDTTIADVPLPPTQMDAFSSKKLSNDWQWSVFQNPALSIKSGALYLPASEEGVFIGHKTLSGNYQATVEVLSRKSSAWAGLGIIGDEKNKIAMYYKRGIIEVIQSKNGIDSVLLRRAVLQKKKPLLKMKVQNGNAISFFYSLKGDDYVLLNQQPINGSFLPPWDRAVRVGLLSKGSTGTAVFDQFELSHQSNRIN